MNFTKIENGTRVVLPELDENFDLWLNLNTILNECHFDVVWGGGRIVGELEHLRVEGNMFNSDLIFLYLHNKDKVVLSALLSKEKSTTWNMQGHTYTDKEMATQLFLKIREEWRNKC